MNRLAELNVQECWSLGFRESDIRHWVLPARKRATHIVRVRSHARERQVLISATKLFRLT
jgi:hypothetical protein